MTQRIASPMCAIGAAIYEAFRYPVPILCPTFWRVAS